MRGADTLIPSRFLSLIGHFCVMVSLLWDSKKHVLHCLPSQYHDSHYQIYLSRITAALSVAIALILIELATFIFGLTMFSPSVSLTSIFCHGSASILFTYFILDGWTCAWFWPLFIFCSVLPFSVDFVVAFINLIFVKYR